MEPLSLTTRRFYATLFFVLFLIVLPVVALYASGYRLDGFSLVPTGGIYVATPTSGTTISLNGEVLERSSLFSRSFFFDNLAPGSYVVQAQSDDHYPWSKNLYVESQLVSDVSVLAVAQPLVVRELVSATSTPALAQMSTSTTRVLQESELADIVAVFTATSSAPTTPALPPVGSAADTLPVDEAGAVALFIERGDLLVRWTRTSPPPSSFCTHPSTCASVFALERGSETVTDAQFFAGGVVYRTDELGVYFSEVDVRQPRFIIPVYTAPGSTFRIIGGQFIIEDDGHYYEVIGF